MLLMLPAFLWRINRSVWKCSVTKHGKERQCVIMYIVYTNNIPFSSSSAFSLQLLGNLEYCLYSHRGMGGGSYRGYSVYCYFKEFFQE